MTKGETGLYYCGRKLGINIVPVTGRCGPYNGPQCSDCGSKYIFNRANVEVKIGQIAKYYCGRELGKKAIPFSNGFCGPNNGPQCGDCKFLR